MSVHQKWNALGLLQRIDLTQRAVNEWQNWAHICWSVCVSVFVVGEEETEVFLQFSDANTIFNVTPSIKAAANV